MTIYEAMKILGYDPNDTLFRSHLKTMCRSIEKERESARGNTKRRLTRELQACNTLIESRALWGSWT